MKPRLPSASAGGPGREKSTLLGWRNELGLAGVGGEAVAGKGLRGATGPGRAGRLSRSVNEDTSESGVGGGED